MSDETFFVRKDNLSRFQNAKEVSLALIILKVLHCHCTWSCIIITHYSKGFSIFLKLCQLCCSETINYIKLCPDKIGYLFPFLLFHPQPSTGKITRGFLGC